MKNAILAKITQGEIAMRSRSKFIWQSVLVAAVVLLAFIVSSFVVSFIIFASKASGHRFLLSFGGFGIRTFLTLFPWKLFILAVVLFAVLRVLLKRFRWGYRNSFLFVFSAVTFSSIVAGTLVCITPLHMTLLEKADHDELPILKGVYESISEPLREHAHGVYKGTIEGTFDGGFLLQHDDLDSDHDEGVVTVRLSDDDDYPEYVPGDTVFVAGTVDDDGSIEAYGVRKVDFAHDVMPPRSHEQYEIQY